MMHIFNDWVLNIDDLCLLYCSFESVVHYF